MKNEELKKVYVVKFMDDGYMIITEEQAQIISVAQNSGEFKSIKLNGQFITINQVTGIENLEVFRRGMKHKLAYKGFRMCSRCHEILARSDICPCKENKEKFPDILEVARKENPKLDDLLNGIPQLMSGDNKKYIS